MARLFFAVGISHEASKAFASLSATLAGRRGVEHLRFVPPDQAHYTLRFLGEVSAERQTAAVRAARAAAAGSGAFELAPRSLGVFPDERRAHTLWIGTGEGGTRLAGLATRLESMLAVEGYPPDGRPFVPHMTLARVKGRLSPAAVRELLRAPEPSIGPFCVEAFVLMESKQTGSGVRYLAVETFSLETPCTRSRSPNTAAPR